jgi:hypothetical protein
VELTLHGQLLKDGVELTNQLHVAGGFINYYLAGEKIRHFHETVRCLIVFARV